MRRRLYFLLPSVDDAKKVVDRLLLARIDESHIHTLAKEGICLEGLPEANMLQKSDFIHGVELGLIVGGATGALAGVIAALFPFEGIVTGALILACSLSGALIGAWASGMIGSDVRNTRLRAFESAMDTGQILLMVDVPKPRVAEIAGLLRMHSEVQMEGKEPTIPAFP